MIRQLHSRREPHDAGREILGAVMRTDKCFEHNTRLNIELVAVSEVVHHFRAVGPERLWRPIERRTHRPTLRGREAMCIDFSIASGRRQHCVQPAHQ